MLRYHISAIVQFVKGVVTPGFLTRLRWALWPLGNRRIRKVSYGYHLEAAIDWLISAFRATDDRGWAAGYSLLTGWGKPYPETTGYIIPTLIDFSRQWKLSPTGIVEHLSPGGRVAAVRPAF